MGMWDSNAWGNDKAADWFGDIMDKTALREQWLQGIVADIDSNYESVRAAVWLFTQLGRVYIWPIDHLDEDLEHAISAAEALINDERLNEEVPEYVGKVKVELTELLSRRSK